MPKKKKRAIYWGSFKLEMVFYTRTNSNNLEMNLINPKGVLLLIVLSIIACQPKSTEKSKTFPVKIRIQTSKGEIVVQLSESTPKHKANFIKLVEEGYYTDVTFHRVIENFMIQGGDATTKTDSVEAEKVHDYTVPAEFPKQLFHKRGVLAAAREDRADRASDAAQFYIVQGRKYTDSTLDKSQSRINNWLAMNRVLNKKTNRHFLHQRDSLRKVKDTVVLPQLMQELKALAVKELDSFATYTYPEAHRKVYKEIGGAAHLDRNYTIFGEVLSGMAVVDSVAATRTDESDKPVEAIRIISMELIETRDTNNQSIKE